MEKYIMSFDAGTTSERAIIFNKNSEVISIAQKEFTQIYPKPGWVEHNPMEIWSAQIGVAVEAMAKAGIDASQIEGIGITNQRETTIVWDKNTGLPIYNAIVWQCRRTTEYCDNLKSGAAGRFTKDFVLKDDSDKAGKELSGKSDISSVIRSKTGLIIDPYFSATKLKWILDNVDNARERAQKGELLFGTVETWLIWKLTKGRVHVTDYSNASRTMLFNINTLTWDEDICRLLDIPLCMLPTPVSNSEIYGETAPEYLGGSIKISGAAGDQQAALFGQKCFKKGDMKNTYGTGCFLLMNTGAKPTFSENGLVTTIGWGKNGKITYALEGSVFMGGAVVQWLRDELHMINNAAETETIAMSVKDTNGCYIVPAFTGLGAPYWKPDVKGLICGLTRGVGRNHIVRAALDSIVYQVNDIVMAMEQDAKCKVSALKVDGGASNNNYLCRTQADISDTTVIRPSCVETTALGAAYLAGLSVGFWKDEAEIESSSKDCTIFNPQMSDSDRKTRLEGWKNAVGLL